MKNVDGVEERTEIELNDIGESDRIWYDELIQEVTEEHDQDKVEFMTTEDIQKMFLETLDEDARRHHRDAWKKMQGNVELRSECDNEKIKYLEDLSVDTLKPGTFFQGSHPPCLAVYVKNYIKGVNGHNIQRYIQDNCEEICQKHPSLYPKCHGRCKKSQ